MKFAIARKLNMTQVYDSSGKLIPVTAVKVENLTVTQVKTLARDGYAAVQFCANTGSKRVSKALAGHVKGAAKKPLVREMRTAAGDVFELGSRFSADVFAEGEAVAVTGLSKGRGFQGVVKRHGFHGAPKTHGHKHDLRAPGSIGSTDAQRVFPGRRMAGRMGGTKVTVSNLKITGRDSGSNILYIQGAVPGHRNSLLIIRGQGEMKPVSEAAIAELVAKKEEAVVKE